MEVRPECEFSILFIPPETVLPYAAQTVVFVFDCEVRSECGGIMRFHKEELDDLKGGSYSLT